MNTHQTTQDESLFCREDVYGRHYYSNVWQKIEDQHYPECPTSVAACGHRVSTLCLCDRIQEANDSAEECLRCHQFADSCSCGAKAQLV